MENNLQIIQYDGKIAIVDENREVKEGDIGFNLRLSKVLKAEKLEQLIGVPFIPKLLAHSPHIDGVSDIVIESEVEKLAEFAFQEELIKSNQNINWIGYGKGIDGVSKDKWKYLWSKGYTQAKQNTYTEEQVSSFIEWLNNYNKIRDNAYIEIAEKRPAFAKATIYTFKELFDKFQQLNQKQYEFVRIDEQGNYVIKEK